MRKIEISNENTIFREVADFILTTGWSQERIREWFSKLQSTFRQNQTKPDKYRLD